VKAVASLGGEVAAEPSEARFTKCLKAQSVIFEKPYSAKYPGRGDITIIDGRRGSLDFQDKEWLGLNGDDLVASLDLGESKSIHKITVGFLQQQGSWIFLPSEVTFFVSEDGIRWKTTGNQSNTLKQTESVVVKDFSCAVKNVSARFVKVASKNVGTCPAWHSGAGDKAWLFVDEVIVE
jgi:hexosaminidase